jgi:hypothetical protein
MSNQILARSSGNGKHKPQENVMDLPPTERTVSDVNAAVVLRDLLYDLGAFPIKALDIENNPDHEQADCWRREALPGLIDRLSPTDRAAVYELIRWLALTPTVPGEIMLIPEFAKV